MLKLNFNFPQFCTNLFLYCCISLLKIYRFSIRSPKLVLVLATFVLIISLFGLTQIRTLFAVHDIGDPNLKTALSFAEVRKDFDLGSSMSIFFPPEPQQRLSAQKITGIRQWIATTDLSNSHLLRTFSVFDLRKPQVESEKIWYFRILQNNTAEELEKINSTPWKGILTNPKTNDLSVEMIFKANSNSQFYGSFDPAPVGELLMQLKEKFKDQAGAYYVAGEALFQYYCHEGINRNHLLNLMLLILFLITFRILFGTWKSGLLYVATLSFMAVVTFGCMAWVGTPIDLISSALVLMMAVAALEDYLFICYEQLQYGSSWRRTMRPILLASFCTSLTTMVGFGALFTTDLLIIGRFGLWAAFAALIQWIATFLLLPAVMQKFPYFGQLANSKKAFRPELSENLVKIPMSSRSARILLLFFPVGVYAIFHLHISGAPKDMMPTNHSFSQGLKYLQDSRGWEGQVHLVFKNANDGINNSKILERIKTDSNIRQILSVKNIKDFLTDAINPTQKNMVLTEAKSAGAFDSFLSATGQERVSIYVKDTSTEPMINLLKRIEQQCADLCFATSESAAHAEFSAKIPSAFIDSFAASILSVSLILIVLVFFLTKAPRPYFSILASSLWGPFVIMTLFWVFQTKINFMACLFTNVLIGLTGDNAIQFLFSSRKRNINTGLSRRGGGSLLISFIICMSCFVFLGSYFNSPKIYGMFLAVGILAATFGDVWILKALNENDSKNYK